MFLRLTLPFFSFDRFKQPDIDILLPKELPSSLRELKPEGNLLKDRVVSLMERNIIEPRQRVQYVPFFFSLSFMPTCFSFVFANHISCFWKQKKETLCAEGGRLEVEVIPGGKPQEAQREGQIMCKTKTKKKKKKKKKKRKYKTFLISISFSS